MKRRGRRSSGEWTITARTLAVAGVGLALIAAGSFAAGFAAGQASAPRPPATRPNRVLVAAAPPLPRPAPAPASTATIAAETATTAPAVEIFDAPPARGFAVQLGAFESVEEAETFVRAHALELSPHPVYLLAVDLGARGTWHRVRAGAFESKEAAEGARRGFSAAIGANALVVAHP